MAEKTFELTEEELKQIKDWKDSLTPIKSATIGGAYTYSFTPNGLGTVVKVTRIDGKALTLDDSDNW
jgi:hypothetical protein